MGDKKETDKYEFELRKIALKVAKDRFRENLVQFDDTKKKNQILLLISSLFITLPLSSELVLSKIFGSSCLTILFVQGITLLVISVILLIVSMFESRVHWPEYLDVLENIGKQPYTPNGIISALVKGYDEKTRENDENYKYKRILTRVAEILIIVGVILVVSATILVLF